MFGMGMPEILVILALALIIIGPKKLPDLAKSLGKALGEFKSAATDIKESLALESELEDIKESFKGTEKELKKSITSYEKTDEKKGISKESDTPEDIEVEKAEDLINEKLNAETKKKDNTKRDDAPDSLKNDTTK